MLDFFRLSVYMRLRIGVFGEAVENVVFEGAISNKRKTQVQRVCSAN
jgi:hypothetical protein